MSEHRIKDLLSKYAKNTISEQDLHLLQNILKDGLAEDEIKTTLDENWKLFLDREPQTGVDFSKNLFEEILGKAKAREHTALKKRKKPTSWLKIAAVFIGIIALGYTYLQINDQQVTVVPNDVITLELEDGTIKIIEEDGAMAVMDKDGNVVGNQNGNQLVYSTTETAKKLAYNTLKVPYGKRFQLQLSDGTKAHLNAGSSLTYPVLFLEGMKREVSVTGEAYFDVAKDSAHPFIVNAEKLNVRVLGTQFNVHAYPEDNVTEVVLVEGAVGLYDEKDYVPNKSTILEPGFKASYSRTNEDINTRKVATNVYTSWREGELVFRNMSFENIIKKMERHFNVTIQNNNIELSKEIFNASFGDESLDVVLKSLKDNYQIDYNMQPDKIIIN